MNLFQTLISMEELCADSLVSTIISIVKTVFTIIQFGVPAVLIILCAIDMFKAMTNGDDKEIAKIRKTSIRRLIYALIIFLIVPIISLIIRFVGSITDENLTGDAVSTWTAFTNCWGYKSGSSDNSGGSSEKCQCFDDDSKYVPEITDRAACESHNGFRCVS